MIRHFNIKKIKNSILNSVNRDNFNWVNGKSIQNFEKNVKKKINCKKSLISCNSGSDALFITLLKLKNMNKNKNFLITSSFSYISSSSIPKLLGFELIYLDINLNNYLIDLDILEKFLISINSETKSKIAGILYVEIFGGTTNLDKLRKISKKHKITLIGDCAQSFGSKFKKKPTVDFYKFSFTSFYPTKIIGGMGDGGMMFVPPKFNDEISLLKNNGHTHRDKTNCKIIGINSRLDTIQAEILDFKLKYFNKILIKRKKISKFFNKEFKNKITITNYENNVESNNYIYCLRIEEKYRDKFQIYLNKKGIQSFVWYKKLLHKNKVLSSKYSIDLNNSNKASRQNISLPINENLKDTEVEYIASTVREYIK